MLDIQTGVNQLSGNESLYKRLLAKFAKQITTEYVAVLDMLPSLVTGDCEASFESAQQLNHKLKGVAGTLAAQGLFEISQQINLQLKQQQRPTDQQIKQLAQALEQTQQAIQFYIGVASESSAIHSVAQPSAGLPTAISQALMEQLHQLHQRIAASEYIDDQELDRLGQCLPDSLQAEWARLVEALDDFDFNRANAVLERMITQ